MGSVSVSEELKNKGHYSTKTVEEGQEAQDLADSGLITISAGGSVTKNGKTVAIFDCTPTEKFDELVKKGII